MPTDGPLAGTPYFFLGRYPDREAEVAAYIRREHGRGRRLSEILEDAYVKRCGSRGVLRAVLRRPDLIRALRLNISVEMQGEVAARRAHNRAGEEVGR
jgi:hypothetical protein